MSNLQMKGNSISKFWENKFLLAFFSVTDTALKGDKKEKRKVCYTFYLLIIVWFMGFDRANTCICKKLKYVMTKLMKKSLFPLYVDKSFVWNMSSMFTGFGIALSDNW